MLYLEATLKQVLDGAGSRGSSLVIAKQGEPVHPRLSPEWRIERENAAFRSRILSAQLNDDGKAELDWEPCRELPVTDGWFENVWRDCREKRIYGAE